MDSRAIVRVGIQVIIQVGSRHLSLVLSHLVNQASDHRINQVLNQVQFLPVNHLANPLYIHLQCHLGSQQRNQVIILLVFLLANRLDSHHVNQLVGLLLSRQPSLAANQVKTRAVSHRKSHL